MGDQRGNAESPDATQGVGHAWESLAEGWRELSARAGDALTRLRHPAGAVDDADAPETRWLGGDSWGLLGADVFDDDDRVVVRIEAPGLRREDFQISINGTLLSVCGDKRFERASTHAAIGCCSARMAASAATCPCRRRWTASVSRPAVAMACYASNFRS